MVPGNKVKEAIYDLIQKRWIAKVMTLNMQRNFPGMQGINKKLSNTMMHNWNVDDSLMKFFV